MGRSNVFLVECLGFVGWSSLPCCLTTALQLVDWFILLGLIGLVDLMGLFGWLVYFGWLLYLVDWFLVSSRPVCLGSFGHPSLESLTSLRIEHELAICYNAGSPKKKWSQNTLGTFTAAGSFLVVSFRQTKMRHENLMNPKDMSCLENMHCSKLFQILGKKESNLFSELDQAPPGNLGRKVVSDCGVVSESSRKPTKNRRKPKKDAEKISPELLATDAVFDE